MQADRLQSSPGKDQHAEYAHAAFVIAAKLVAQVQDAKGAAASSGNELTAAANAIDPARPLSPQGENVRKFFRLAAKALP